MDDLLNQLKNEFETRKKKNPLYSLRAYARDLGIEQSLLVRIFNGERKISERLEKELKSRLSNVSK